MPVNSKIGEYVDIAVKEGTRLFGDAKRALQNQPEYLKGVDFANAKINEILKSDVYAAIKKEVKKEGGFVQKAKIYIAEIEQKLKEFAVEHNIKTILTYVTPKKVN